MQHDAEPQKSQDGQLVVNMMWNHRNAPSQWCDRGALYPVLGGGGITRKLEVHDPSFRWGVRDVPGLESCRAGSDVALPPCRARDPQICPTAWTLNAAPELQCGGAC